MVETVEKSQRFKNSKTQSNSQILNLKDIKTAEGKRMTTGEAELDSVL